MEDSATPRQDWLTRLKTDSQKRPFAGIPGREMLFTAGLQIC